MYIKLNDKCTKYHYNAIDPEGGQSRSSLFIELNNNNFGIFVSIPVVEKNKLNQKIGVLH